MMAVMAQSEHIEPLLSVEEYISLGRIPYKKQLGDSKNILEKFLQMLLRGPLSHLFLSGSLNYYLEVAREF